MAPNCREQSEVRPAGRAEMSCLGSSVVFREGWLVTQSVLWLVVALVDATDRDEEDGMGSCAFTVLSRAVVLCCSVIT